MIRLNDADLSRMISSDCPLNRARRELSAAHGRIEQRSAQRVGVFDVRRMEIEAVYKIVEALGLQMPNEETLLAVRETTSRTPDQAAGDPVPEGEKPQG